MKTARKVEKAVKSLYEQLDEQAADDSICKACGKCCDFERYGHRLFITTPELVYFQRCVEPDKRIPMEYDVCPYMSKGKCTVHQHRFAGCRIFFCGADSAKQSELSEKAVRQFKEICKENDLPYEYIDLKEALNRITNL